MEASELIALVLLADFHLQCLQVSWYELREHLLVIVARILAGANNSVDPLWQWGGFYKDAGDSILVAGALAPIAALPKLSTPAEVAAPLTFTALSCLYMEDREISQKPSTAREAKLCHKMISKHLANLDLRSHSRADLVAFRERLSEGRMPSTVNKLIVKLSSVFA